MPNEITAQIGKRLREAREALSFSQEQVAQYLGINRVQVSYLETGKRDLDMDTLVRLSDLYGYSRAYFVGDGQSEAPIFTVARAREIVDEDLEKIALVNRFAKNLRYLNSLLGGKS